MKKISKSLFLAAASAFLLASCQIELVDPNEAKEPLQDDNTVILTLNAGFEGDEPETKTSLDGSTPAWTLGDKVTVVYTNNSDAAVTAESSGLASTASPVSFTVGLTDPKTSVDGYAYYPANNKSATSTTATLVIDDVQHPTGTSFDGESDILVSKGFTPSGTVDAQFRRLGAILKIKLSNATINSEKLKYVSVTGESDLAGDIAVRLSDGTITGITAGSNTVTATYEALDQFALNADGKYVYLIVYPQTLAKDSHLIIYGETENYTFTKDINLKQDIVLKSGHIQPLNISIASISKVFFEERFVGCSGTMNSPSGDPTYDNTGWAATGTANAAESCAKYGSSSAVGNVTTPEITIPAAFDGKTINLSFRAVAWKDDRTSLNLTATNASLSSSSVTLNNDTDHTFKTFDLTLTVTDINDPITINFLGESNSTKPKVGRFYLDDVLVYVGTKPIEKPSPSLSFSSSSATAVVGDAFTEPTLSNPNSLSPITWESDNTSVATVDSNGKVTAISSGSAKVSATFRGNATYRAQTVSYDLTVENPSLTLSGATTPAKASSFDNSTVTFTVTANIGWTATKGTDANSIIKSVSSVGNTVTVTFNENIGGEKTAEVNVTPTNPSFSAYATQMTVTQEAPSASYIVTYTVSSKTSASKTYGTAPVGSAVTYSQTFDGTAGQMTADNSITLTLTGYDGKKITAASVSVHSNKSSGSGGLTFKSGSKTIASIADGTAFNNSAWYGSYYNTGFVDVDLDVTETTVGTGENVVLTINASVKSLFFESITITYE